MLMRGDADHLAQAIGTYCRFAANARDVMARLAPGELLELHQDDLIAEPAATLGQLCTFLELDEPEGYIDACAAIVIRR